MNWQTDFKEYQDFCSMVRARAKRVERMIWKRAQQATREAHLDPSIMGIHLHNAWISFESGTPWRKVDYQKVRLARWLCEQMNKPGRLADRVCARAYNRLAKDHGTPIVQIPSC